MGLYNTYIALIFIVKILFIFLAIVHLYQKGRKIETTERGHHIDLYKDRCEFVFITMMALLLMYIFNPFFPNHLRYLSDNHTRLLFYLFGLVLLITAKWDIFFKEGKELREFQSII